MLPEAIRTLMEEEQHRQKGRVVEGAAREVGVAILDSSSTNALKKTLEGGKR
jgi:hypothetical protein